MESCVNLLPDEILVLPVRTDSGDLQDEDAIVVEKVVDLPEVALVPANSNVLGTAMVNSSGEGGAYTHLGHLETDDLGEGTFLRGNFSVVHAKNAGAAGVAAIGPNPLITELGLILAESDTSNFAVVVLMSEGSKSTPSASNVKQAIFRLEVEFLANHGQLVVLESLKVFLLFDVQNDARGVNHTGTEEPSVEIIAS